jgi:hypothetical protein
MNEPLAQVYLNCLYCGAKLRITDNIVELTCRYCGTAQVVEREGGNVTLTFLFDKLDRFRKSAEKGGFVSKIQNLQRDLEKIEGEIIDLERAALQKRDDLNSIALGVIMAVGISFLAMIAGFGSVLPLFICAVVECGIIWWWLVKIKSINADFYRAANPLIEKKSDLIREISRLERFIEF